MEVLIKQEPIFDSFSTVNETSLCCFLCHDGEEIFKAIADHYRENHFEAYNQLPDLSIVQLCHCSDITSLQSQLIVHLLQKLSPKFTCITSDSLPQTIVIEPNINIEVKEEVPIKSDDVKYESDDNGEGFGGEDFKYDEDDSMDDGIEDFPPFPEIPEGKPKRIKYPPKPTIGPPKLIVKPISYPVQCPLCPKTLSNPQWLLKHHNIFHNPVNKFKCDKCSKGHCKTLKNLKAHLRMHDENQQEEFDRLEALALNPPIETVYECDHCERTFTSKPPLYRHIITHFRIPKPKNKKKQKLKNRTKVLCQHCSLWLSSDNLKRHIQRIHSDDKYRFKCDVAGCGKDFSTKFMLNDHKNLHLGLKPYQCNYCGISFSHNAVLRRHKFRHTDPEKFKCNICSEIFVSKRGVDNHVMRKHTDVGNDARPFACDVEGCTATFKYDEYLQEHKRGVHIRKRKRVRGKNIKEKKRWRLNQEVNESEGQT